MHRHSSRRARASLKARRLPSIEHAQSEPTLDMATDLMLLTSQSVLGLQRTVGNTVLQRMISARRTASIQRYGITDLWNDVTSTASKAWDFVTGDPDQKAKNTSSSIVELKVPGGSFTVTDPQAVIRRPPPDLTAETGKPIIPAGSLVMIEEGARKNGKDYVFVRDYLAPDEQGPPQYAGWTTASNIEGLAATLSKLNAPEDDPSDDVVIPRPSGGTPGLPEQPELDHPEFTAIVQELDQLEQDPLAAEKKHGEETGQERTERVEAIGELRQRIAGLASATPAIPADQLKRVQTYLYRRLAPLAPYYGQMANTNILAQGSKGWDRTCNVTVPAMVIEGLGKTKDDYADQAKLPLLRRIFDALEGKYKARKVYDAVADFDDLRLPDFMAVVGIAKHLKADTTQTDEKFAEAVASARKKAASVTTSYSTMMYLIGQFGGSSKAHNIFTSKLEQIGGAQKAYTKAILRGQDPEEWRELYNEVESGQKTYDELSEKDQDKYKALWKYDQLNKAKADELLSVSTYREAVLKKVNPQLDQGAQILVGMEQHFVRLDALDLDTLQVDDPGEKDFKNLQVTWEQARNLGYFKQFWVITG